MISDSEFDDLKEDIKYDRSPEKQKMIDKYRYEKLWDESTTQEIKSKLFFKFSDVYKQQSFYNIMLEKQNKSVSEMLEHEINRFSNSIVDLPLTTVKLNYIRRFNDMLELTHSQDCKIIEKNNMDKCAEYIRENIKDFNAIYNCNVKLNGSQDKHNLFKIIKKIYSQWSGMQIVPHEKDRTKIAISYRLQGDTFFDYIKNLHHSHKEEILQAMEEG